MDPRKSGPAERKLVAHFPAIFLQLDFWDSKVKAQVCVSGDLFFLLRYLTAPYGRALNTLNNNNNLAIFFAAAAVVVAVAAAAAKKKKQSISRREQQSTSTESAIFCRFEQL